jgi:hypothetical protein
MIAPVLANWRRWTSAVAALAAIACSNTTTTGNTGGAAGGGGSGGGTVFGDAYSADTKAADAQTADASVSDIADTLADGSGGGFGCDVEGQTTCFNDTVVKACVEGQWQFAEKCLEGEVCNDGKCGVPTSCQPSQVQGCEGPQTVKLCADDGKAWITKKCPGVQQCVQGACKDVVCTPGFGTCLDQQNIQQCKDDGSGYDAPAKCKAGSFCFGGKCVSACETNLKISNNVGCEYWSVDLDSTTDTFSAATTPGNVTPDFLPHSIVISNPGQFDADVTFTVASSCGASLCAPVTTCGGKNTDCKVPSAPYQLEIAGATVKAGATKEFKMPVINIDGSGIFRKAIRINSTQPIVAFQFNPFNADGAASNDASLLLPVNTLGKTYYAIALSSRPEINFGPKMPSQNGYLTVVASSAGETTVTVTPTAKVYAAPKYGVPQDGSTPTALDAGKAYTFKLKQFDVLNLEHLAELDFKAAKDLTGTQITADKNIAVFCGHEEAVIGNEGVNTNDPSDPNAKDSCCAEHIEEQMMPLEAWGKEVLCTKTKPRGTEKDLFYLVAGEAGVAIQTVPPIAGLDGVTLAKAGDYVKVQTDESFMVKASGKVQMAQFIVSRGQTEAFTGDPSFSIVPPKSQYREEYVIQTASGYGNDWVTIVRPKGMAITADGKAVADNTFTAFGDGTWELGYYQVTTGSHTFASVGGGAFGLMVYGYGKNAPTAYSYPAGMNLIIAK